MKLEIELDLNKIDYDAINKQIAEKVAALDIKDMYNIESKIDSKISTLVKEEVDYSYTEYLNKYWSSPTSEGEKLIETMSKAEIENRTKKIIDDIFAADYNEEVLRELMIKFLPDVFAAILFRRLESTLFTKECNYNDQMFNMIRSHVDCAINNKIRY